MYSITNPTQGLNKSNKLYSDDGWVVVTRKNRKGTPEDVRGVRGTCKESEEPPSVMLKGWPALPLPGKVQEIINNSQGISFLQESSILGLVEMADQVTILT